jgi:hypothetical protein
MSLRVVQVVEQAMVTRGRGASMRVALRPASGLPGNNERVVECDGKPERKSGWMW